MRKLNRRPWLLLPLLVSGLAACSSSTPTDPIVEPVNEAAVLVAHLEGLGYDNQGGFVMSASDVRTAVVTGASQYVIDLRSATDFAKGHVQGAVNVALTSLPAHLAGMSPAASSYVTVVLICYSGQTAAFATGVVRALGYTNVKSMKWGMSAWHTDFSAPWVNGRSNARAAEFITGSSPSMNAAGELPTLNTGKTTGVEIAEARAATVLGQGFSAGSITHATLYNGLSGYYIVNFWPAALYQNTGHIAGAIDYDPAVTPFKSTTYLKTLPTNKPVVIYCYSGQSSAYVTGYLRVLGYDARSLLYGANGMIFDKMISDGVASAFVPETQIMDYDYVK